MTARTAAADADTLDRAELDATARRDRDAFEQLYRRHHARLAGFLRRFTHRRDLIDDVVNDTMWVVWRQAATFRGESKVSTWITGIAYRCMLKGLRSGAPSDEIGEVLLDGFDLDTVSTPSRSEAGGAGSAGGDPEAARELRDWLARGLATLPDDQRVTLELAYFLGLSCDEIAAAMGCAAGTVKARMFHARVRLRNVMPALGGERGRAEANLARG